MENLEGNDGRVQEAAEALAPEAALIARYDPMSFGMALARLSAGIAARPSDLCRASLRFAGHLAAAVPATSSRLAGIQTRPALEPAPRDHRFADPAWDRNPLFFAQRQAYLAWSELMHTLAVTGKLEEPTAEKAMVAVGAIVNALAPTNFLVTNPTALRKAFETRGLSVLQGLGNFVDDVAHNGGRPRQVDMSAFEVGRDLACTPGKVIFRNDLMELIQYAPQTETVHDVPLLLSPPWINKYYVMDLAPGRSFVEWAVQHGHTVFAISYRNPDESMRDVALDDYLIRGPLDALDVIREITGSEQVNLAGLCIGGTLSVMLLAYLAARDDPRIRSATLLNTLVDFSQPGPLGAFTDAASVKRLERRMAKRGYLESTEMAAIFNSLRENDLLWNYVASNWLMGESPPAFDILAWNADGTRMPAAMHSFYLQTCYVENQLARGRMSLAGTPLGLEDITSDVYVVAARDDHIAPWRSSYATTGLLESPATFVLSSSGHIAGIVNPPSPKRRYWTNGTVASDPDDWLAGAEEHAGSWWEDWLAWIEARAGGRRQPPGFGSPSHPVIGDAPGTYVHG